MEFNRKDTAMKDKVKIAVIIVLLLATIYLAYRIAKQEFFESSSPAFKFAPSLVFLESAVYGRFAD